MRTYKILIIDDDADIINSIIDFLEHESNYIFYRALNGKEGIAVAEKFIPDLIITDWEMPEMSGISVIQKLKESAITKGIPVIMLTGIMTSSKNLETALRAGSIDFIRKPIDEIELIARIKSMLMLADSYNEIIDLKDRELTLVALNIKHNSDFNLKLVQKLNTITNELGKDNDSLQNALAKLAHSISMEIKSDSWTNLKSYFNNVHPLFFQNLLAIFPEISPAEMKLAAYLRLNLSTKEIAAITFITPGSIKTARNRLRKKLKISPNQNLSTFLISF